jgi:GAF domain-containing protein
MSDNSDRPVKEMIERLEKLDRSTRRLDDVLAAMFEVLADKGLRVTPHLEQAQESMKRHVTEVRQAGQTVMVRLEQLKELIRITALITSSLEIDDVLQDVLDTVIELTGAERAYLMLYDDKSELQVRIARNWDQKTLDPSEVGLSRSVIELALQEGQAIITSNAQQDTRLDTNQSILIQKLRSIICIPLALRGQTVGVLYADNRLKKDLFQEDMVPMLTAFGTQAAIAINNAQRFGAVKENLQEARRVIQELRIEIDRSRVEDAVSDITDSDYFQSLASSARTFRERFQRAGSREQTEGDQPEAIEEEK